MWIRLLFDLVVNGSVESAGSVHLVDEQTGKILVRKQLAEAVVHEVAKEERAVDPKPGKAQKAVTRGSVNGPQGG